MFADTYILLSDTCFLQVIEPLLRVLDSLATAQTVVLLAASIAHSPETIRRFVAAASARGFVVEVHNPILPMYSTSPCSHRKKWVRR